MKCPCEQCIVFAMCFARIREVERPDVVKYSVRIGCEDLRKYVCSTVSGNIIKTRLLFGLPEKKPRKPRP